MQTIVHWIQCKKLQWNSIETENLSYCNTGRFWFGPCSVQLSVFVLNVVFPRTVPPNDSLDGSTPRKNWQITHMSSGLVTSWLPSVISWRLISVRVQTCLLSPRNPWWRHQMETFSALLAICAGNSPVSGEFPTQRPVTRSFDVYFDLRPDKRLSKQSLGWWFETLSHSLWRHRNALLG